MNNNQEKNKIKNTEFNQNNYQLLLDRLLSIKEKIMSLEKKFLVK